MAEEPQGLKLLAQHLAKVKLEAEESKYEHKATVERLNKKIANMQKQLDAYSSDIGEYKEQVKALERQGTRKTLFNEREQWKKLVENLRKDKKLLQDEVNSLRNSKVKPSDNVANMETPTSENGSKTNNESEEEVKQKLKDEMDEINERSRSRTESKSSKLGDDERIKLESEINILRTELAQKSVENEALREKLDLELELKWERGQQNVSSWKSTLFESFKEVLSPVPPVKIV